MGLNKPTILSLPILIIFGVMLHNGHGLLLGYMGGKLLKMSEVDLSHSRDRSRDAEFRA